MSHSKINDLIRRAILAQHALWDAEDALEEALGFEIDNIEQELKEATCASLADEPLSDEFCEAVRSNFELGGPIDEPNPS